MCTKKLVQKYQKLRDYETTKFGDYEQDYHKNKYIEVHTIHQHKKQKYIKSLYSNKRNG